jgi:flagellar hook-basal body complex protein FliE
MTAFVAGETDNLHQVMISMQEAHINFQMVTEIRNKAVEVFQDLSRMQI